MIDRFLKYSLERQTKICAVLGIDEDGQGFTARFPGRKKETHVNCSDVLTCAYARGDQGELEKL